MFHLRPDRSVMRHEKRCLRKIDLVLAVFHIIYGVPTANFTPLS